jgi:hypothetical protein
MLFVSVSEWNATTGGGESRSARESRKPIMLSNSLKIMCAALFCGALLAQTGCDCGTVKGCTTETKAPSPCATARGNCDRPAGEMTAALPPNAKAGECYAKVFVPPEFKTVTERVLVRDASETIEVIPAKYEWVEEKIVVRDASTELEAVPAEYASKERTIEVNSGHTDWEINKNALCVNPKEQAARDVFCLVKHEPASKTIQTQTQVKPAHVQTVCIPAKYETVRREKLASAATTRKVCIPAEYENIEKTVKVCDGRMAWKLIDCDKPEAERVTVNTNSARR